MPKALKKAIIVEYEFHYGFLYSLTKACLLVFDEVQIYSNQGFVNYILSNDPKLLESKKIKFFFKGKPFRGTLDAIIKSAHFAFFAHFSVQSYKLTNLVNSLN